MAQKVTTLLTDDISGEEIPAGEGETISYAFQGFTYEIDLDADHAKTFSETISFYIEHSRRIGKTNVVPLRSAGTDGEAKKRRTATPSDLDPAQVRAWAESNGYEVSPRGRIKGEIVEAYKAANG
jgi:Lsr2